MRHYHSRGTLDLIPVEPKPLRAKAEIVASAESKFAQHIINGIALKVAKKSEFDILLDSLLAKSEEATRELQNMEKQAYYE